VRCSDFLTVENWLQYGWISHRSFDTGLTQNALPYGLPRLPRPWGAHEPPDGTEFVAISGSRPSISRPPFCSFASRRSRPTCPSTKLIDVDATRAETERFEVRCKRCMEWPCRADVGNTVKSPTYGRTAVWVLCVQPFFLILVASETERRSSDA
jgi:hypothetical protein